MTVAELKAYTGASDDGRARYFALMDGHHVVGWTGPVSDGAGWWWAITRWCGLHEIVVCCGWTAGSTRDMRSDVERALRVATSLSRELAS